MSSAAISSRSAAPPEVACPDYPPQTESLLGALLYQRDLEPERVVCHRLVRGRAGLDSQPLTVAALLERAAAAAQVLRSAGVGDGDRVILSLSDPHDFLVAFFAAQATGASAVPLPTVVEIGAPSSFAARVRSVCRDCEPRAAVVEGLARFSQVVTELPSGVTLLAPATLSSPSGPLLELADRPGSSTAFIQYTSGSTGSPKGVVVTHGNILANCHAIRDATDYTRADRMVAWLPLHHDMGLIGGLLTSIYCAAETWLMPPMAFLARPATWFEAMTKVGATLPVAPTFAYSLCARKLPAKQLAGTDLSSLRLAYVGAEPVDPGTMAAFIERFRPYGLTPTAMYPVYGLAEATLAAAFPKPGQPLRYDSIDRTRLAREGVAVPVVADAPDAVTFVSVGGALPRHRIEIVDPETGKPVAERAVGELVVEGDSLSPRYFGEPAEMRRPRLHTGDLAYTVAGQCFIVDRIKDLVIVAGHSYAPSDIENVAAEVVGARRGRVVAFSTPGEDGTEELQLVAEMSSDSWADPRRVAEEIRRRVRREIGLNAATVALVAPGSLERTSSGKIKRRACVEAHRAGALAELTSRAEVVTLWFARQLERLPARVAFVARQR